MSKTAAKWLLVAMVVVIIAITSVSVWATYYNGGSL